MQPQELIQRNVQDYVKGLTFAYEFTCSTWILKLYEIRLWLSLASTGAWAHAHVFLSQLFFLFSFPLSLKWKDHVTTIVALQCIVWMIYDIFPLFIKSRISYLQGIIRVFGFKRLSKWNFPFVRSIGRGLCIDTVTVTFSFNFGDVEEA